MVINRFISEPLGRSGTGRLSSPQARSSQGRLGAPGDGVAAQPPLLIFGVSQKSGDKEGAGAEGFALSLQVCCLGDPRRAPIYFRGCPAVRLLPPGADPSLTWLRGWELLPLVPRLETRLVFSSPGLEGAEHRGTPRESIPPCGGGRQTETVALLRKQPKIAFLSPKRHFNTAYAEGPPGACSRLSACPGGALWPGGAEPALGAGVGRG